MEAQNDPHSIDKSPCIWNFTYSIFTIYWLERILKTVLWVSWASIYQTCLCSHKFPDASLITHINQIWEIFLIISLKNCFKFISNFYLKSTEDARITHTFVHCYLPETAAKNVQVPENLKHKKGHSQFYEYIK